MQSNFRLRSKVWLKSALRDPGQFFRPGEALNCPCCGYSGRFATGKRKDRVATRCPNCESKPRDRQVYLYLRDHDIDLRGASVLHFAPEWPLFRMFRDEPGYVGGDILRRRNANAIVDITRIGFPRDHFDYVLCNHVLEHVPEDRQAMAECHRVMKPGGLGIFTVPLSDKYETWEPPAGMSVAAVESLVGWDHKRLYGRDLADKLRAVGFEVSTARSAEPENSIYRLFGETLFVARKPAAAIR